MTSTVTAALSRLVLGWAFVGSALWWVLSVQPSTGPVVTLFDRHITKADLPALPLLVTGLLLSVLAVVGRRARRATVSTVLLSLSGVTGWLALWWVAIEPAGDGALIAPITPTHGVTESDIIVIPTMLVAALCGLLGVVQLIRSAAPYPGDGVDGAGGDAGLPLTALFGSPD